MGVSEFLKRAEREHAVAERRCKKREEMWQGAELRCKQLEESWQEAELRCKQLEERCAMVAAELESQRYESKCEVVKYPGALGELIYAHFAGSRSPATSREPLRQTKRM